MSILLNVFLMRIAFQWLDRTQAVESPVTVAQENVNASAPEAIAIQIGE
jgi:hypothetical protein